MIYNDLDQKSVICLPKTIGFSSKRLHQAAQNIENPKENYTFEVCAWLVCQKNQWFWTKKSHFFDQNHQKSLVFLMFLIDFDGFGTTLTEKQMVFARKITLFTLFLLFTLFALFLRPLCGWRAGELAPIRWLSGWQVDRWTDETQGSMAGMPQTNQSKHYILYIICYVLDIPYSLAERWAGGPMRLRAPWLACHRLMLYTVYYVLHIPYSVLYVTLVLDSILYTMCS